MNTSIFNEEFTGYLGVVVTPKRLVSGWRLAFTQSSVALPLSHEPLHCRSLHRLCYSLNSFSPFHQLLTVGAGAVTWMVFGALFRPDGSLVAATVSKRASVGDPDHDVPHGL